MTGKATMKHTGTNKGGISDWAFNKAEESYDKVASEDIGRVSIAQPRREIKIGLRAEQSTARTKTMKTGPATRVTI